MLIFLALKIWDKLDFFSYMQAEKVFYFEGRKNASEMKIENYSMLYNIGIYKYTLFLNCHKNFSR